MNITYCWAKHYSISSFLIQLFNFNFIPSFLCSLFLYNWVVSFHSWKAPKIHLHFNQRTMKAILIICQVYHSFPWRQPSKSPRAAYSISPSCSSHLWHSHHPRLDFLPSRESPSLLFVMRSLVSCLHLHILHHFSGVYLTPSHKTNVTYFMFLLWYYPISSYHFLYVSFFITNDHKTYWFRSCCMGEL